MKWVSVGKLSIRLIYRKEGETSDLLLYLARVLSYSGAGGPHIMAAAGLLEKTAI